MASTHGTCQPNQILARIFMKHECSGQHTNTSGKPRTWFGSIREASRTFQRVFEKLSEHFGEATNARKGWKSHPQHRALRFSHFQFFPNRASDIALENGVCENHSIAFRAIAFKAMSPQNFK